MSLPGAAAFVAVPGLSFTWRMNLPVPCNKRAGSGSAAPVKETHVNVRSEDIDLAEGQPDSRHARAPGLRPRIFASRQTTDARWLSIHLLALSSTHRWRDPARQRR